MNTKSNILATIKYLILMCLVYFLLGYSKALSASSQTVDSPDYTQASLTRDRQLDQRLQRNSKNRESEKEFSVRRRIKKQKRSKQEGQNKPVGEESSVEVKGELGATVYIYETDRSFTPDFLSGPAKFGLSGKHGPFAGVTEASLADSGSNVQISSAYVSAQTPFSSEARVGRTLLPSVNSYLAKLNIYPFGLGIGDGVYLSQDIKSSDLFIFSFGGGVVNALSDDVTVYLNKRSASEYKGYFCFVEANIGFFVLKGILGSQQMQMTFADDLATPEIIEERGRNVKIWEASAGLDFDTISVGGFFSQKFLDSEQYVLPAQSFPESVPVEPLLPGSEIDTYGGGVSYKMPLDIVFQDKESVKLSLGYSEQLKRSLGSVSAEARSIAPEGQQKEQSGAVSLSYSTGMFGAGVNYAHFQSGAGNYKDPVSGRGFSSVQRASIDFSYKISKIID